MDRRDPALLRISDDDRHQVAEVLRHAAGEGRIDLDELDERLQATYEAKTYSDLVPITADLPARTTGTLPVPPLMPPSMPPVVRTASTTPMMPLPVYQNSIAFMGDCSRRGIWRVPAQHTAFSMMGSVTLDLREASFEAAEVTITAVAIMAGIDVVVNPQTQVVVDGVGVMGDFSQARDKAPPDIRPDSPVVHVKGLALMAGVNVVRKPMPGDKRRSLRG